MDSQNSLHWTSGCEERTGQNYNSLPAMYQASLFPPSELLEMEPDAIPSAHTNQSASRIQSYSMPIERQAGQSSLASQSEKACPLLAGQNFKSTPRLCGSEAVCLEFSTIPEIEECVAEPCISQKPPSSLELPQTCQPAPLSIPHTEFKKPTRNSRQRLQRTNSDDFDTKSHSKKAHLLVERRYRENLGGNIAQLHLALLKTKRASHSTPQDQNNDPEEDQQALSKVHKSDVMLEAVDYVRRTEVELRHMADEIELLRTRVGQLEKLVKYEDCALMKQLVNVNLRLDERTPRPVMVAIGSNRASCCGGSQD